LEYESDQSEHGLDELTINTVRANSEEHALIKLSNVSIKLKLDSGAEANVLIKQDFDRIVPKHQRQCELKPTSAKLTAFGGHSIPILGVCFFKSEYKGITHVLRFHVVTEGKSLLGCEDCKALKLVSFHVNTVEGPSSGEEKSFTKLSNRV